MAKESCPLPDTTPLREVRAYVVERINRAALIVCPCCSQEAKRYHRRLRGALVADLIRVYRYFEKHPAENWLHVSKFLHTQQANKANDVTLTRHWDMLVGREGWKGDGNPRNGWYTHTQAGWGFVRGRTRMPEYVWLYNGKFLGHDMKTTVDVYEALGTRFNYAELMGT